MGYTESGNLGYVEVPVTLEATDLGDTCPKPDLHKFEAAPGAPFWHTSKGDFYYECRSCGTVWASENERK